MPAEKNSNEAFLERLSDAEKRQIVRDYEQWERDGILGMPESLRERVHAFMNCMSRDSHQAGRISFWMRVLVFECCRYFAKKYLEEHPSDG
jgi:hypothetical protein